MNETEGGGEKKIVFKWDKNATLVPQCLTASSSPRDGQHGLRGAAAATAAASALDIHNTIVYSTTTTMMKKEPPVPHLYGSL